MKIDLNTVLVGLAIGATGYFLLNKTQSFATTTTTTATNTVPPLVAVTGIPPGGLKPGRTTPIVTDEGVELSPSITPLSFLPEGFLAPSTPEEKRARAALNLSRAKNERYPPLSPSEIQAAIGFYREGDANQEAGVKKVYSYPGYKLGQDGLMYWDGVRIPDLIQSQIDFVNQLGDCNKYAGAEEGTDIYCQYVREELRISLELLKRPHWPGYDISAILAPMQSKVSEMRQSEQQTCSPSRLAGLELAQRISMERYCQSRFGIHSNTQSLRERFSTDTKRRQNISETNAARAKRGGGPLANILKNFNKQYQDALKPRPIKTAAERAQQLALAEERREEKRPWFEAQAQAQEQFQAWKQTQDKGESEWSGTESISRAPPGTQVMTEGMYAYGGDLAGSSFRRRRQGGA